MALKTQKDSLLQPEQKVQEQIRAAAQSPQQTAGNDTPAGSHSMCLLEPQLQKQDLCIRTRVEGGAELMPRHSQAEPSRPLCLVPTSSAVSEG